MGKDEEVNRAKTQWIGVILAGMTTLFLMLTVFIITTILFHKIPPRLPFPARQAGKTCPREDQYLFWQRKKRGDFVTSVNSMLASLTEATFF
jgi:hypothetical protein